METITQKVYEIINDGFLPGEVPAIFNGLTQDYSLTYELRRNLRTNTVVKVAFVNCETIPNELFLKIAQLNNLIKM